MTDGNGGQGGLRGTLADLADGKAARGPVLIGSGAVLALLVALDFAVKKKPYFEIAGLPLFSVWFGLGTGLALVALAWIWRSVLGLRGTYGDD